MFGFLKDKIKNAISSLSKKAEELSEEKNLDEHPTREQDSSIKPLPVEQIASKEESKQAIEEKQTREIKTGQKQELQQLEKEDLSLKSAEDKKSFFGRIKEKLKKKETIEAREYQEPAEDKKGFFDKIKEVASTKKISGKNFDEIFYDLELALLESNVAYSVVEKIKCDLKDELVDKPIKKNEFDSIVINTLRKSLDSLFNIEGLDLISRIKEKKDKPFIIVFVGVNGVGKTSSIAKLANYLKKNDISCLLAASDTWRAASIEQLEHHANKLGIKIIKHNYGSDPTAVSYEAVSFAKSKGINVVLIDTAGRQHSNVNLISEMQKIIRVIKPDLKIFVGESITGSDCIEQASNFDQAIGIDGIILSKADIDEKGGAAISIEYIVKKPILYIGTGQGYDDLAVFSKEKIIASIGLDSHAINIFL